MRLAKLFTALVVTTLAFGISNCIDPYAVPALLTDYNYLVIEGMLINETDSTIIKLSRTRTLANESKETTEEHAQVKVEEENGVSYTLIEQAKGIYSLPPLKLDPNKRYRLHIYTKDTKEYASDFVELRQSPVIEQLTWKELNSGIQVSINTKDIANKTWYYLWTFEDTWKYSAAFFSNYRYVNGVILPRQSSEELYYCWRTLRSPNIYIHSTQALSEDVVSNYPLSFIPDNSRKLVYGYSMQLSQFAITKEAYEYWALLLKNNEKVGSLFDALPSKDIGNFHSLSDPSEPVLGYFSASSISRKRILIDRQEITGPSGAYEASGYENCATELVPLNEINSRMWNNLIIEKKYSDLTQVLEGYVVSTKDCIDCRSHGGTLTKPDYWNR